MKRFDSARLLSLATLASLAACSGGGGATADATAGGDFLVLKTEPVNGQIIYLNDPVNIDLSQPVDIDTASLNTVSFQALDQLGAPVSELVTGTFRVDTTPGDAQAGRRLQFVPTFASNNTFSNGGFRAGRSYLVRLVGGDQGNTVLRARTGKPLTVPSTFQFSTRDGTQPAQLYRNPASGGPRRTGLEVSTATSLDNVPLGLYGAPPLEVRLHFNQALNPNDGNVPVSVETNPLLRDESKKGRVYLEYHDPEYDPTSADFTWIPADAEIERNDLSGATLVLRPVGVLPNNAVVRVIVEPTLEDISGESNSGEPSYNRVFGEFHTSSSFEQQWNGIVEDFATLGSLDLTAAFAEAQAEVGPGYIKAGFAFEGKSTILDYQPTANEVVLNTAFTQIVPANGLPFTVTGGVFNFRNVTIPQGVTVLGSGPNPMVWLCNGRMTVAGTLSVRGGNGARVDTLNSANFAKAGGVGSCGGGNGGDGTPSATLRDLRGGTGRGPLQEAGTGGRGGYLACTTACFPFGANGYNDSGAGSGGGGGTMATQGDPNYRGAFPATPIVPNTPPTANTNFQQVRGFGGSGCSGGAGSRQAFLNGGEPGDRVFVDTRVDNNFWGSSITLAGAGGRALRITGELPIPVGGGGGGGGGDTSGFYDCSLTNNTPANDYSGGGGGGGGGVLIVKALDEITVQSTGKITADGGHGGGGEQVGSCGEAGGGGGGAGGMVILMSAKGIVFEAHGSTTVNPPRLCYGQPTGAPYAGNDYSFAVSADGGVCLTGGFGSVNITSKYPAAGTAPLAGSTYDGEPLGGFGGMGIVQLMVPPGNSASTTDGTNTILDDNIHFRLPGSTANITGLGKQQLLGWRGFPLANGTFVNDLGGAFDLGKDEGDIRPSPTLMPCPFAPQSRARSTWIDTGASQRRALAAADDGARGLVTSGGAVAGPRFEFAGLNNAATVPGFVNYETVGTTSVKVNYPIAVPAAPIADKTTNATFLGKPAYRVTLGTSPLGEANRYSQYEAELLNANGNSLISFRILGNTLNELLLDPGVDLLPAEATQLQVRAKFFKVVTNNSEGLGPTYQVFIPGQLDPVPVPIANVRIGFAFHRDPNNANLLFGRFPGDNPGIGGPLNNATENDFISDLNSQALQDWINAPLAQGGCGGKFPRYVQWDVTFDMAYKPLSAQPPSLTPTTPRPALEYLRIPFRF